LKLLKTTFLFLNRSQPKLVNILIKYR